MVLRYQQKIHREVLLPQSFIPNYNGVNRDEEANKIEFVDLRIYGDWSYFSEECSKLILEAFKLDFLISSNIVTSLEE